MNKQAKYIINILHFLVWACFLSLNYYYSVKVLSVDLAVKRLLVIAVLNAAIYIFCYKYLVPKYFVRQQYLKLFLYCLLIIFVFVAIRYPLAKTFASYTAGLSDWMSRLLSWVLPLFSQALMVMVASLLSILKINFSREQELASLKIQEAAQEVELIKAKINPHFLLNTLNNIYAINFEESPKTSAAIMQLSKVLSYTIYKSRQESTTLEEEIELLNSLIGLYQLKFNHTLNIAFDIQGQPERTVIKIPSLVLFSLLENAFKHSFISAKKDSFIHLKLKIKKDTLYIEIENSVSPTKIAETDNYYKGGLGHDAIKNLLQNSYGNKYSFQTISNQQTYKVTLEIYE